MSLFERELDAYEREVAARKGEFAGGEARGEMAGHLEAALAARLAAGESEEEARAGALAAFGDPRRVARGEGRDLHAVALVLAPGLVLLGRDVASEIAARVGFWSGLLLLLGPAAALGFASGIGRGQRRSQWQAGLLGWGIFSLLALFLPPGDGGQRGGLLSTLFDGGSMVFREDLLPGGGVFAALALPFVMSWLAAGLGRVARVEDRASGSRAALLARVLAPLIPVALAFGKFENGAAMMGLAAGVLVFGSWPLGRPDYRSAAWGAVLAGAAMFGANLVQYGGRMAPLDPGNTLFGVGYLFACSVLVQSVVAALRWTVSRGARVGV